VLVHPVKRNVERSRSAQLMDNFHCYRGDSGLVFVQSDFPLTHVYEDQLVTCCVRSELSDPRIRTYTLVRGYYEGSFDSPFNPSLIQCFAEIVGNEMKWDFICPRTWGRLKTISPDSLRHLHRDDGYLGVTSSPGGNYMTFVPPTWGSDEVMLASGLTRLTRQSWGWLGDPASAVEIPLVQSLLLLQDESKLFQWFQANGWKRCFSFEPDRKHVLVLGVQPWSRFYRSRVRDVSDFCMDISRSFGMSVDGPYDASLDLRNYDRMGRPLRKGRTKKKQ